MADLPSGQGPTLDEVRTLLAELLPRDHGLSAVEVSVHGVTCIASMDSLERALGGSVSGPAIFWAVDVSAFLTVNACVGKMPSAVLAQCSISFLEPAEAGDLRIAVELEQLGTRTAVTTARVTDGRGCLVAVGTLHFALPTLRGRR